MQYIPDDFFIHVQVLMCKPCSHSFNRAPGNLRIGFDEVICQGSFNKTTFYTWADAGKEGNADFTGAQVIAQLTALASGSQSSYSQASFVYGSESSTIIIVIIAATIAACGVGIFLLKRKHN